MASPKINLTELLADREAGTGGEWEVRTLENFGFNIVHYVGGDRFNIRRVAKIAADADETNARRIARLPALEAAYIEAVEVLRVVAECGDPECTYLYDEEGVEGWRWTHPDGREWTEVGLRNETAPLHPLARKFLGDGE